MTSKDLTPKEKAKELVDFYLKIISDVHPLVSYTNSAKQCALRTVNEIIKNQYLNRKTTNKYWEEVKQEIEDIKLEIEKL